MDPIHQQHQLHAGDRSYQAGMAQSISQQRQPGVSQQMPLGRQIGTGGLGLGLNSENGQQYLGGSGALRPQTSGYNVAGGNSLGLYGGRGMNESLNQGSSNGQKSATEAGLSFDPSNFPVLSAPSGGSSRFVNLPSQSPQIREEDFTIASEDFPALPGSQGAKSDGGVGSTGLAGGNAPGPSAAQMSSRLREVSGSQEGFGAQGQQLPGGMLSGGANGANGVGMGGIGLGSMQRGPLSGGVPGGSGAPGGGASGSALLGQMGPDGGGGLGMGGVGGLGSTTGALGQAPSSRVETAASKEAKFGLSGLLDVIRMTDKDLNTLALGSDLTTFGLNLTSVDCLYSTFSSPFADQPSAAEPQFSTPSCYLMHPPSLKAEHLSKFQIETLFYMFYAMPKDMLQAFAAHELYRRDWRYHGELKLWLKARTQQELMQVHPNIPWLYFDASAWEQRLYSTPHRGNLAQGLLTEEDVRVRPPQVAPGQHTGGT